ncbi:glycosyl hydrolase 115 family protein [Mucilaginibacter sp. PAMB04274]|uniref:glycosyl hydrolase 115 family protein n=1 Tax=Mucilaginibacter sp. PAMB04274 TaxID=3138568 RepID=UPI0031F60A26
MHKHNRAYLILLILLTWGIKAYAVKFDVVTAQSKVTIVYEEGRQNLDSITAHLLAQDIQRVTGYLPKVLTDINAAKGNVIIVGTAQSALLVKLNVNTASLKAKWETYALQVIDHPTKSINHALAIIGSDARGMAYGVFDISERMGVSPWYWWADVKPVQQKVLTLEIKAYTSAPPSVKYRGIFINDEDWGLQPWAAKTYEPETGDIGPKTYARIFELLLRLKANLIWPAMHPSTKAFYSYPGNAKVAADYQIEVGSSHAEPMLRNNVGEWNEKTMGHFNYVTNKQSVYNYWESRVKESSANNAIYTMGMRGVHDSGMEGVKGPKEAVPLLEQIIADQRGLLQKYVNRDATKVPQVFTIYKEVLDVYENGLTVPDDITLMWTDDNYGYIQRLSNAQEQQRKGGSGVYYHASYWGRPHDYLWLSTTSPGLMREEMMKAYDMNAREMWVLNIGDLKPCEYNMQLFLDMAYQAGNFESSRDLTQHLQRWCAAKWGAGKASHIRALLQRYYNLAWERRPEFMGWSQTEPTTKTNYTAYNHFAYGDEAANRVGAYQQLAQEASSIYNSTGMLNKDAFYELVYYPVNGASLINQKFLYRDKAYLYGKQNRLVAQEYAEKSRKAYQSIFTETEYYNHKLAGGKWNNIMSMQPRNLPVYQEPDLPAFNHKTSAESWGIAPEGWYGDTLQVSPATFTLPVISQLADKSYFVDVYLKKDTTLKWKAIPSQPWITLLNQGELTNQAGKRQIRTYVSINWKLLAKQPGLHSGKIDFTTAGKTYTVLVKADNLTSVKLAGYKGLIEKEGMVSIFASSYTGQKSDSHHWDTDITLGYSQHALIANYTKMHAAVDTNWATASHVSYDFYTLTDASRPQLSVFTVPTHPLNKNYGMRYAVSVDGSKPQVVNFKTEARSNEWKNNVLSNNAIRKINFPALKPGKHQLKLYVVDPGVIVDRFLINLTPDYKPAYSLIPENKL